MWRAIDVAVSNNEGSDCPDEAGEGKEALFASADFLCRVWMGRVEGVVPGVLRSESSRRLQQ